mmetsp:Transcript_7630/g.14944  ORF Transcript_7630/g.14944 Transcript_7630/m.14944 type:complete len:229 (-) Transcript_7630:384-1070(-)
MTRVWHIYHTYATRARSHLLSANAYSAHMRYNVGLEEHSMTRVRGTFYSHGARMLRRPLGSREPFNRSSGYSVTCAVDRVPGLISGTTRPLYFSILFPPRSVTSNTDPRIAIPHFNLKICDSIPFTADFTALEAYLAMTSTSTLTWSPMFFRGIITADCVCDTSMNSNQQAPGLTAVIVRLVPSTAMYPFSTMLFISSAGTFPILIRKLSPSFSLWTICPVPSTWPCT